MRAEAGGAPELRPAPAGLTNSPTLPHVKPRTREERIANGTALLDQVIGPLWPLFIDLSDFDITSGSRCVLGQIGARVGDEEGYDHALYELVTLNGTVQEILFKTEWESVRAGELSHALGMSTVGTSTSMWAGEIRRRQEALGGPPAVEWAQKRLAEALQGQEGASV